MTEWQYYFLINNFIMTFESQAKFGQDNSFLILTNLNTETVPEIK